METINSEKDFSVTKRKHFAKLHERIQNKYNEMQKRLQKSKSVDCLTAIGEDNVYTENVSCISENDLSDDVFVQNERHSYPVMHTVIVEDIDKQEVTYTDVGYKEVTVSESKCTANINKNVFEFEEDAVLINWSLSSESLNELDKKSEESASLPSTPKLSFKNKIGSRISAARQRRREEKEKERNKKNEVPETATKVDKFIFSNSSKPDLRHSRDKKVKLATATIALIEVTGLETDTEEKQRVYQCRFRLGFEKWKSKSVKNVATQSWVKWQELFSMNIYDEMNHLMEVMLFDDSRKDPFVGKTAIDLSDMEREKTHVVKTVLEGVMPTAELFLLLTITGTPLDDLLADLSDYRIKLETEKRDFAFYQLNDFPTVGRLSVIVYGAKGLAGSDCYCHLKLINERRQTQTENKTNEPNWMKTFTFTVTDITSILDLMVYDEKKNEEVGRVVIPLLNINNDAKIWYALKDNTLREQAKGNNPRLLLEMRISWNIIKASARVIRPKEYDFLDTEDKFDRKLFLKNVARAKVVVVWVLEFIRVLTSCFEWESRKANTIGLISWLLFTWYFGAWMLPLLLVGPFIWYRPEKYFLINWRYYVLARRQQQKQQEQQQETTEKEEKRSLRQKINNIQDLIQSVQNFIGKLASFGESVKNLFNFSVPFLSCLTIFFLLSMSLIVYFIPPQYILMAWGIKKYVRKIIWPNRKSHSEVIDLLSRVPDDEVLNDCEYLPIGNLQFGDDQVYH